MPLLLQALFHLLPLLWSHLSTHSIFIGDLSSFLMVKRHVPHELLEMKTIRVLAWQEGEVELPRVLILKTSQPVVDALLFTCIVSRDAPCEEPGKANCCSIVL